MAAVSADACSRSPTLNMRVASALALPVAPLYGAYLSYAIYHAPRRHHHRQPADFDLPFRELWLDVPGEPRLHLWLCPGASDRVVVVGHGIGLSKSAGLRHARFLHDAGYTVCLFDLRNHGASGRDRAWWGMSARFTSDVTAVVNHLRERHGYADARIAVYGFSFSTFPVLYVLTRENCAVDAIVCDSGPVDLIPPVFRRFLETRGVPVPAAMRVNPSRAVLARSFASFGTAALAGVWPPTSDGAYAETPLLFLAGEDDALMPPDGVSTLASRYPRAQVAVLPRTDHLQGLKRNPTAYPRLVLDFLDRSLA